LRRENRVLGGVRLGERSEVANVDEHHGHLAALAGKDIITLLQQTCREGWIDVGAECRLKSLPLSQSRLHAVERRRQRTEVIVLNHRQASCDARVSLPEELAVGAGWDSDRASAKLAEG